MNFDFENVRYSYWFNIIVIAGWFFILATAILFYFISYDGMIAIFLHIELIKIWFIIITLSFIFFILEKIFNLKIKNSLVKKQGYKNFQQIGFFYFFLFLVVTICLFIF